MYTNSPNIWRKTMLFIKALEVPRNCLFPLSIGTQIVPLDWFQPTFLLTMEDINKIK